MVNIRGEKRRNGKRMRTYLSRKSFFFRLHVEQYDLTKKYENAKCREV
jgi:hypothetical protein